MTKNTRGSEWEKWFNYRFFVVTEELPEKDYFSVMPTPLKIKQFIATERQALLQKVRGAFIMEGTLKGKTDFTVGEVVNLLSELEKKNG